MNLMDELVIKNLRLNKKRTIVTVVGIILAVALLSALSTLVVSFRSSLVEFEKNKNGNFHVKFSDLENEDIEELKRNVCLTNFNYIKKQGYALLEHSANEDKPYAMVLSTDASGMKELGFRLLDGRYPEKEGEVMISRHLKTNGRVDYKIGDTITLRVGTRVEEETGDIMGESFSYAGADKEMLVGTKEVTYTVVGICERPGYSLEPYNCPGYTFVTYADMTVSVGETADVYVRFTDKALPKCLDVLAALTGCDSHSMKVTYGDIKAATEEEWQECFQNVTNCLSASRFGRFSTNEYLIMYERLWPIDDSIKMLLMIGMVVAIIIIFTSVYCIKNSFEISVTEKIRQYGMLAGIGATKSQIRKSVHKEAAIMGTVGIPVGVASGLLASFILIKVSNVLLKESLSLELVWDASALAIVAAVLLGILTIYLSAISGARKAAKVSPIEAIRNSNEIKNEKKQIKTPRLISKLWGIGGVVSYKNIKRNRRKYRTTVISIVICTITFIVISYFMSMGFDLVGMTVTDDECNLYASMAHDIDSEKVLKDMEALDGVEQLSVLKTKAIYAYTSAFSGEYIEKCMEGYTGDFYNISVVSLDKESYNRYLAQIGKSNSDVKSVLVNNFVSRDLGDIKVFDLKKGDSIKYFKDDYTNAVRDEENGQYVEGTVERKEYSIEIDAVTTERPFGMQSHSMAFLVVDEDTLNSVEGAYSGENAYYNNDTKICIKTIRPDANQDEMETIFESDYETYKGAYIFNRDKNARETRSILTLLAIFAYGFITVIALIGVTNIVNTIGTGMNLRAREFAMLRSVGMTGGQFEKMVRLESIFTSAKALFWGCLIGLAISFGFWKYENIYDVSMPYHPPIKAALLCSATVIVLVYLIIRISLARINKRNIIETIKNENL